MQIPKFIPQFDYLRGLAVLAVMLYHSSKNVHSFPMARYFSFGWIGVDLFFVLSGFLITGILLGTRDDPHFFRNFYARRILRIWPLYFALLGGMLIVVPHILPSEGAIALSTAKPLAAFILFVQNLAVHHPVLGPLGVTWSLAIEEQYYFVWPFLVWILPRPAVKWTSLALFLGSPALRLALQTSGVYSSFYTNTFTRLDGLALGSFLAVWLREAQPNTVRRIALTTFPIAGLLSILVRESWIQYWLIALTFGAVLCLSISLKMTNPFLRYTGKISFGLYLLQLVAFDLARHEQLRRWYPTGLANDVAYLLVAFGIAYLLATLSWFLFERPVLSLKQWFEADRGQTQLVSTGAAIGATVQQQSLPTAPDTPEDGVAEPA